MTGLVTTISGQFTRSLTLGALLPALVFWILAQVLLGPLVPEGWTVLKLLPATETGFPLLAQTLSVVTLSGLLFVLTTPLFRLYEGYPWLRSPIGQFWVGYFRSKRRQDQQRWEAYRPVIAHLEQHEPANPQLPAIRRHWERSGQRLVADYPSETALLPTRLGNVIRSFEHYPGEHYSMESIVIWPRLLAKMDQTFAGNIENARANMLFMLNAATLSAVLAVAMLVSGLWWLVPFATIGAALRWAGEMVALGVLARLFYHGAIGPARAWGNLVRAAFDLYRRDLLKQLGFAHVPTLAAEERALWRRISERLVYGEMPASPMVEYIAPESFATSWPETAAVSWQRHVAWTDPATKKDAAVRIRVVNRGQAAIDYLIVKDTVPVGMEYELGSISLTNGRAVVRGANPYHFHLTLSTSIAPNEDVTLSYAIRSTK
ncbi:MAG TPA: hypothetical protein VLA19_20725 [Herpetosiphonaceae bacterium]|nr:hypothetical protein [Herpetosiphonaceae bacterium]